MSASPPPFGVVMPIRNETDALRRTLPPLLRQLSGLPAKLVCVCNGCQDDSAQTIRELGGDRVTVIELPRPGKTGALQAGDVVLGDLFPRFYLDADVVLQDGAFQALLRPLCDGEMDLVGARRVHRTEGVSWLSAAMAQTWDALPHAHHAGFLGAVGLSEAGRGQWGAWPEVSGDDIFAASHIPADRRLILSEVTASTCPPSDFAGWVRMRARWKRGERELLAMGLELPRPPGQREALLQRMTTPAHAVGAWAFAAARLCASLVPDDNQTSWIPDRQGWRERQ
ncbi:glycosyltransferase [Dinoroseobacter sp. S375]|uniref:glycosyltransferase n=1 Tax=Dinoroseobacter sp. S375 TaxID=3415136 RepID=UPI003C7C6A84